MIRLAQGLLGRHDHLVAATLIDDAHLQTIDERRVVALRNEQRLHHSAAVGHEIQ